MASMPPAMGPRPRPKFAWRGRCVARVWGNDRNRRFDGYMELYLSILLDIWNYTIQVVLLKGILAVILLMEEIPVKTHLGCIKLVF